MLVCKPVGIRYLGVPPLPPDRWFKTWTRQLAKSFLTAHFALRALSGRDVRHDARETVKLTSVRQSPTPLLDFLDGAGNLWSKLRFTSVSDLGNFLSSEC
ncbi:hypothetical protein FALCPG4_003649 [Fusarium falciforme]